MRHFEIRTEISAPPDRVWAVMCDAERWHEWTPSVTRITRLEQGPLSVGSRALIRQPKFPPALFKVTAIEPGRSFTWVSVAPGLRVFAHHRVEPAGGGSQATLSLDMEGLFGGLWGRLTRGITERYLEFEAKGLKARSENAAFRHSASPGQRNPIL